ncbi:hypothetical protein NNJEOMEG_01854 [Fundidesulfovibrio magnetotacticus]|uniref:Major facilitator superfamily (MFS) profile domain-containing protein n=1 Tax=Fundidesulfovibrio magnetotacticus TaxID=2730080 RepID=A0A6V8LW30_9BACT|nr:MFS transporter [Fundidesulfovibrio magnetotacticus]GFK94016.1 hypothetical protein NNJEOMEG_01854 [Fundidesulfovibrio magnetotacticus]
MPRSRPLAAWALYDFAASAYATCVATALLPAYFAAVIAPEGLQVLGHRVGAVSLWGYASSLCALTVFVLAPVAGAAAGLAGLRRVFLAAACAAGGAAALAVSAQGPGDVLPALGLFVLAQAAYNTGNAFYDAYLPQLSAGRERDRVSGLGYACGYAGGGLGLALALALVSGRETLGLDEARAVQWGMALCGAWWLALGLAAVAGLPGADANGAADASASGLKGARTSGEARIGRGLSLPALAAGGFREAWRAASAARRTPGLGRFLLAYLFYNDGVQTVIAMAAIYGRAEIGLPQGTLLVTLLAIQGVALAGAVGFARLAGRIGARKSLMAALAAWSAVAVLARGVTTAGEYFALGLGVGVALGGSQALSRSVFSRLVPPGEEPTVYYGFFSVLSKLSAVLGPLVFAAIAQATGSARPAIVSLTLFFAVGLVLLARLPEADTRA